MVQVNVQQAKTHLSRLLTQVEQGETVIVARDGKPVARLVALSAPTEPELGFVALETPDSFFDPLPESELDAWNT